MRFLWPDEIDAATAHTSAIVAECTAAADAFRLEEDRKRQEAERRGKRYRVARYDFDDAVAETLDHEAFESFYADLPERAAAIEIEADDRLALMQFAWLRLRDGPRPPGAVGYVVFDHDARLCQVEHFDSRAEAMPGLGKGAAMH
jgi:hypothetical protein